MIRKFYSFPVTNAQDIKLKMLNWANRFNICCFLDNQNYDLPHHSIECLVGAGVIDAFEPSADFFSSLGQFTKNIEDFIFGHFSYDCKNFIEDLSSDNPDGIGFSDAFLFVPQVVLKLKKGILEIGVTEENADNIFHEIISESITLNTVPETLLKPRLTKDEYISIIQKLKQHIHRGDCYEINYCQELYNDNASLDFLPVYVKLLQISPNPFSAYYRCNDKYLACASPERYIKKTDTNIISQPIKGTAARNLLNASEDEQNKKALQASAKEQRENVMIVDLVRNDLSKICEEGSVQVDELMKVYSFPNVHQMISTISGILPEDAGISEVLQATFPMGSMTGAPKLKVMQLIELYEMTKRGIYSGAVGYIAPNKDFDFNVVIRSIMYNSTSQYLSCQVGGGITFLSDPASEYEECLLKATAIHKVLSGK